MEQSDQLHLSSNILNATHQATSNIQRTSDDHRSVENYGRNHGTAEDEDIADNELNETTSLNGAAATKTTTTTNDATMNTNLTANITNASKSGDLKLSQLCKCCKQIILNVHNYFSTQQGNSSNSNNSYNNNNTNNNNNSNNNNSNNNKTTTETFDEFEFQQSTKWEEIHATGLSSPLSVGIAPISTKLRQIFDGVNLTQTSLMQGELVKQCCECNCLTLYQSHSTRTFNNAWKGCWDELCYCGGSWKKVTWHV